VNPLLYISPDVQYCLTHSFHKTAGRGHAEISRQVSATTISSLQIHCILWDCVHCLIVLAVLAEDPLPLKGKKKTEDLKI